MIKVSAQAFSTTSRRKSAINRRASDYTAYKDSTRITILSGQRRNKYCLKLKRM